MRKLLVIQAVRDNQLALSSSALNCFKGDAKEPMILATTVREEQGT